MKKIVLVSMVKNEADIIESFVRHSLTYADELIIADHQSSDGTWEILQKLQAEGLPLTLKRLYRVEFALREVVNGLIREAILAHGADIVLPFDADEFLVNTENDIPCRQVLEALDPGELYGLHWRNYEPVAPEKDRDTFLLSRQCRRGKGWTPAQKTIVGARSYIEGRPYELVQGQHFGEYIDDGSGVPMAFVPLIHTAHYHWRSPDQYATKVATSWLNNTAKYTMYTTAASYLKKYFDGLRHHESLAQEGILEDAEPFDLSQFVPPQTLRYTPTAPADVQANVMAAAEQIAEQLVETKVLQRQKRVSMILIWMGRDDAAWQKTLESACSQTYPYLDWFVLCMADGRPAGLDACNKQMTLVSAAQGNWAQILEERVQGDYVQWLLPGETMRPNKVQRMVAFMETQDFYYGAAFAARREESGGTWKLGLSVPFEEPAKAYQTSILRKMFLQLGRYPIGGLCAGLFRRTTMASVAWFERGFLDGRPMVMVMWCEWMRAVGQAEGLPHIVGILRADFCDTGEEVTADAFCWHQLQWASVLQMAEESPEMIDAARDGWKMFVSHGGAVVQEKETALASSPFYPEYLRLLAQARERCE